MKEGDEVPALVRLMFGEKAGLAQGAAGEQLLRWSQAFEAWLEGHKGKNGHRRKLRAMRAWRELLEGCEKAPWEVTAGEVEGYLERLQEKGLSASTRQQYLSDVDGFYRWCIQAGLEAGIENPAKGVKKPKRTAYSQAQALSAAEAQRLLEEIQTDEGLLSRRDYAFFLMRLRTGAPTDQLLQLQWGQLQPAEETAVVDWRRKAFRYERLPEAVWQAILTYLTASGRLGAMRPEEFVFAPLRDPLEKAANGQASDWNGERAVQARQMSRYLKRFGRRAGIADEKLSLPALRHTAALLRLEAGDDLETIQATLGRASAEETGKYLKRLVERAATDPAAEPAAAPAAEKKVKPARREPHPKQPGEGMRTGKYARQQPSEEVAAVLAEGKWDLQEEIDGLEIFNHLLLDLQSQASTVQEMARTNQLCGTTAGRLKTLLKTNDELKRLWKEQERIVRKRREAWGELFEAFGRDGSLVGKQEGGLRGKLLEAAAAARVVLRRTLKIVTEGEGEGIRDARDLMALADSYGGTGVRLASMLKSAATSHDEWDERMREVISEALDQVADELGLDKVFGPRMDS